MTDAERTPWTSVWPFVACIAVVAVSGAGLILTIPHLIADADPGSWSAAAILATLTAGFGMLGRRVRPALAAPEQ